MKNTMTTILFAFSAAFLFAAEHLQSPAAGDLISSRVLRTAAKVNSSDISRDPVSFTWPLLESAQPVNPQVTPMVAQSREYWLRVSTSQLNDGIVLPITAEGALVRMTPQVSDMSQYQKAHIDPIDLVLVNPSDRVFSQGKGLEMPSNDRDPAAAKMPLLQGSAVFKLSSEIGVGEMLLFAENLNAKRNDTYVIQVFDKHSAVEMQVQAGRDAYLYGDTFTLAAGMFANGQILKWQDAKAALVSPSGQRIDLAFDGQEFVPQTLESQDVKPGQLWTVEVDGWAEFGGVLVHRTARTAFAYALPTAALTGEALVAKSKHTVLAELNLEVGVAGRYELSGTLFGTNAKGALEPILATQTAQWFEAGQHVLGLELDRKVIERSGLQAPFRLMDVRLGDQSRMGLLHRQADGLIIE